MAIGKRVLMGAGTAVLALLLWSAWRFTDTGTGGGAGSTRIAGGEQAQSASVAAPASPGDDLPASLRGTQVDGGVRFDSEGMPVTDADLRRYFDWYLAAVGEQDLPAIRARLTRDLALRMTPAQASAVLGWFDRYVAYQRASTELAGITDLEQRLRAVQALRRQRLGETAAEGFFGEEENEALRVLALKRARSDPILSEAERLAIEQGLEAGSPGYATAIRESALREQLGKLDTELERQGASASERHAERSALLGSEAADRFAELDRERSDWNARLQTYSSQLATLRARTGLSEPQRRLESQRLLAAFTPAEQRRIAALLEAGALH
ncbi:MAG TPA: lipase secretion chaperone [Pseudoxanthomonas sp.]|nr:lipase secretion chaperone [Pseudoxanthomonas sp.]